MATSPPLRPIFFWATIPRIRLAMDPKPAVQRPRMLATRLAIAKPDALAAPGAPAAPGEGPDGMVDAVVMNVLAFCPLLNPRFPP